MSFHTAQQLPMSACRTKGSTVWKNIRILFLLLILAAVAFGAWSDRVATTSWQRTLWVGIYPLNADGTQVAQRYIEGLTTNDFADIEAFFVREGRRYDLPVANPVHIELYPQGQELPPALEPGAGRLSIAWWSLRMRMFAWRASHVAGRAPPRVRMFVLYHDPTKLEQAPDSHGLQKGLIGIVHAFADRGMSGQNDIVIAHEFLHTVGASDKYDLGDGEPVFPIGYADRDQKPLYPQGSAEIMAGRRPLSATQWDMPRNLNHEVVGPETALEIRWAH
jgi:hypothetical protein